MTAPYTPQLAGTAGRRKATPTLGYAGSAPAPLPWASGISTFDGTNNLLSSQINPTDSAATSTLAGQSAGANSGLSGFTFNPFQNVAMPDYTQAQGALNQGNTQLQNLNYNYGAANGQYQGSLNTLQNAGNQANSALTGINTNFGGGGGAQADTGTLNSQLANSSSYVGPQFADAADTGDARAFTLAQLKNAGNAPDRGALAASNFQLLQDESDPAYQQSQRNLLQQSAAFGRRGSAQVNSQGADLATARETMLNQARQQLSNDSAAQTLQDRLNLTNAGLGVTQGFGSEDRAGVNTRLAQAGQLASNAGLQFQGSATNANLADSAAARAQQGQIAGASLAAQIANSQYGHSADLANAQSQYGSQLGSQEGNRVGLGVTQAGGQSDYGKTLADLQNSGYTAASGERNAGEAGQSTRFSAANTKASTLANLLGQSQQQDANNNNQLRTERDYQTGRSDKAVSDENTRRLIEDQLTNSAYNRAQGYAGLGFSGSGAVTNGLNSAAGQAQGQSDQSSAAIQQLLQQLLAGQQGTTRRSGAGAGTVSGTTNNGGLLV